jgi:glycosyltransferase involved in cell wall biosynthesis
MSFFRPIRLAVYFDQSIHAGGGFQQSVNAALLARDLPKDLAMVSFFVRHKASQNYLESLGISATLIPHSRFKNILNKIRRLVSYESALRLIRKIFGPNSFEKIFLKNKIDLIYFLSPCEEAIDLEELNYIITIWDLSFREDMEFPEIRFGRSIENRERLFQLILRKASAVFVDSDAGKDNVIHYYGIGETRVHVMPFSPASPVVTGANTDATSQINIAEKYNLSVPYIFYPAQFWSHKNHAYILFGLKNLERDFGYKVGAIFSGVDKGNQSYIVRLAEELDLINRIKFIGFVDSNEMPALYKQALALAMPTYFGPTNLPPLEAFALGVPVLYPDKAGLKDQVKDAALLINLEEPKSMAIQLVKLMEQESLRLELIERGIRLNEQIVGFDRLSVLFQILINFRARRSAWDKGHSE